MSWIRDGREGRPQEFTELADLEQQGLVRLETVMAAHCTPVSLLDESDCDGWIPATVDGPCPRCGEDIWLDEVPVHPWTTLHVSVEPIACRLEAVLRQSGAVRRLEGGVAFAVTLDVDDVLVVVADWSEGSRWMINRTLQGRPFVLIQVDECVSVGRLGTQDWVVTLGLARALRDPTLLNAAVRRAAELADLERHGPAITELHRLTSRVVHVHHGARRFELGERSVTLDDVVVPASPAMVEVLGYLVDRHLEDRADGNAADGYCSFQLSEMAVALEKPRHAVQKQLHRFRTRLEERYQEQVLRPLPANSVLELTEQGWRLSAECLVRRSA